MVLWRRQQLGCSATTHIMAWVLERFLLKPGAAQPFTVSFLKYCNRVQNKLDLAGAAASLGACALWSKNRIFNTFLLQRITFRAEVFYVWVAAFLPRLTSSFPSGSSGRQNAHSQDLESYLPWALCPQSQNVLHQCEQVSLPSIISKSNSIFISKFQDKPSNQKSHHAQRQMQEDSLS